MPFATTACALYLNSLFDESIKERLTLGCKTATRRKVSVFNAWLWLPSFTTMEQHPARQAVWRQVESRHQGPHPPSLHRGRAMKAPGLAYRARFYQDVEATSSCRHWRTTSPSTGVVASSWSVQSVSILESKNSNTWRLWHIRHSCVS